MPTDTEIILEPELTIPDLDELQYSTDEEIYLDREFYERDSWADRL